VVGFLPQSTVLSDLNPVSVDFELTARSGAEKTEPSPALAAFDTLEEKRRPIVRVDFAHDRHRRIHIRQNFEAYRYDVCCPGEFDKIIFSGKLPQSHLHYLSWKVDMFKVQYKRAGVAPRPFYIKKPWELSGCPRF
jgi:hypothetical protein